MISESGNGRFLGVYMYDISYIMYCVYMYINMLY